MIRHDDIWGYINIVFIQVIKPFVNRIISICFLEEWKPFKTGKGDEVKTVFLLMMLEPDSHGLKLIKDLAFNSRGLCHTQGPERRPRWTAIIQQV